MSLDAARAVADAVLWEGYLLYPYRSTSSKNRIRWQFGVLGPPNAAAGVAEEPAMHVECLLDSNAAGTVETHLRFLHLVRRQVFARGPDGPRAVDGLDLGAERHVSFDEATACELPFGPFALRRLLAGVQIDVRVPAADERADLRDSEGLLAGHVVRARRALSATLTLRAEPVEAPPGDWLRLAIDIENAAEETTVDRNAATALSFIGAHLLLDGRPGAFASLLEPPPELADTAQRCTQRRCWPVLAGTPDVPGVSDVVLASPIILYDHPSIAPESAGSLFDSTEIDEILTLRVMTMTDEEKRAARATDPAAAAIIDRCDSMTEESLARLHGALRDPRWDAPSGSTSLGPDRRSTPTGSERDLAGVPVFTTPSDDKPWWDPAVDGSVSPRTDTVLIDGAEIGRDSLVRIRPTRRADAQDLFYAGQAARVVAVYSDVDGNCHVAVVLLDDPAADMHEWYGRYLYYAPDELEPLEPVIANQKEEQP